MKLLFLKNKRKEYQEERTAEEFKNNIELKDLNNRNVYCNIINPIFAKYFNNLVRYWNDMDVENGISALDRRPITLYIDSAGGDMDAAFTIIDTIKLSKTPINTINIGICKSWAFLVYLSGQKRIAYSNASFVFNQEEIDNTNIKDRINFVRDFIIEKTKISEGEYNKTKEFNIYSSDEAYKLRISNEQINTL